MARKTVPIDQGWTFRQVNNIHSPPLPVAQFPTNVHLDLLHHGLIPDPNIGKNEDTCQWVGEKSWLYQNTFTHKKSPARKAVLVFEGLDTHATVTLNGATILKTENMFIPERVEVTDLLKESNKLEILFESTYLIGKKLVEKYPEHRWGCWNGDPSRLAVRKAQYHYGWDWGPALLTCGPWRPIFLETYDARISDLAIVTDVHDSLREVTIHAQVEVEGDASQVSLSITYNGDLVAKDTASAGDNGKASITFRAQNPHLWYPHSYGAQPLYLATAELLENKTHSPLDVCEKRFGIRKVKVAQRKLAETSGTSFHFEINNTPIFCGGSNWIPADSFIPRITPARYRDWVRLAVAGNQLMLRVWGGGIYEQECFYEACDELGILIWQDFMFACGNYPAHPEFLALVKREATSTLKRLRHHPSIALFAGNNEDYQYAESEHLQYDPQNHDAESWLRTTFPARYIYEKILPEATASLAPNTHYHPGSPYGGETSADPTVGDLHQWNVWHGSQRPYQDFPSLSGRFVSEFGMEALPSTKTIDSFLAGEDDSERYALSSTLAFHNKAAGHDRRLAAYMTENVRHSFEPLEMYVYHTQLMQAECLATAYRSFKRGWKGPGREECGGALVWQMNDCWPGTSWAVADHYLRPKLGYYAIKRELKPLTIGIRRSVRRVAADKYTRAHYHTIGTLEIWATNLSLEAKDVRLTVYGVDLMPSRRRKIQELTRDVELPPNRSTELVTVETEVEDPYDVVFAAYLHDSLGMQLARAVNWPEPLKWVHFPKPDRIRVKLVDGEAEAGMTESQPSGISLSADVCVKGLQLEFNGEHGFEFEDNGFDLVPAEEVFVGAKGLRKGDEEKITLKYLGMDDR